MRAFLPRDAMHPRYYPWACACLSVSVSVTSRSSTKTAKRRITKTKAHDTPVLYFSDAKDLRDRGHPRRGHQMQVG